MNLDQLLKELAEITDRDERMEYLIELGEDFKEVPPDVATRPFPKTALVPGCESEAYVFAVPGEEGNQKYYFAVENPQGISAKAMAVILDTCLSGRPREEVLQVSPQIVYDIFGSGLSMGKGHGLSSMLLSVQTLARNSLLQQRL